MQKALRITGLFLFVALILSPFYLKNLRQYFEEVRIIETQIENISNIVTDGDKICTSFDPIKIPANDNKIQVLHIISPKCKACVGDMETWRDFPAALYRDSTKDSAKVQIINVIDTLSFQSQIGKDMISDAMKHIINDTSLDGKLIENNIELCSGVVDRNILEGMNIKMFPLTVILKQGEVIHISYGSSDQKEMQNLANIISSIRK